MGVRASGSPKGFVLYYEDLAALQRQLSAEDALAVIVALGAYARTAERPEVGSLSPAAAMAFEMMAYKVEESLRAYGDRSEKRKQAAGKRWANPGAWDEQAGHAGDAASASGTLASEACTDMQTMQAHANDARACNPCNGMQSDARACNPCNGMQMQTNEMRRDEMKRNDRNKESGEETSGIARGESPPDLLSVDADELIAQAGINRQIEEAGRAAGVFVRDWDDLSPEARNERADFELMLAYRPEWVLEAIERARQAHKASPRYVLGILRSFKARGKSDSEAKAERESARLSRDPPAFEVIDGVAYSDGMEWIE